ncbi:HIT family protein [Brevundimonas sp.]|uniref:HIT family protein n=1 Tax=Brevundimonas sp. TaxID=1871086 RepID=UPI002ABCD939|nr:HIT family protein [Brevundimonas sp.]MDZ4362884.1 HIT family protein [Brevundimonas sp.]
MRLNFLAGLIALAFFSGHDAASAQSLASDPTLRCPMDQPYEQDNPFARILRGELPASLVYEDEQVIVIMPLEWDHPGHALVIPKRPVRTLFDMTPSEMGHALDVARQVGVAQQRALGSTGFTLVQNNGRSQHVCHVHFHVIPNTPRATQNPVPRADLDHMAERLRAAFPRD